MTKVYSLRDVIHATAFGATAPAARAPAAVEGGGGGMGGGGFGGGGGGGGGGVPVRRRVDQAEERAEDIIELIQETVDPDSWRDNGGTLGTIDYVPWTRSIIVTHTPTTHSRIAHLLEALQPDTRLVTLQVRLVELEDAALREQVSIEEGASIFRGDVDALAEHFNGRSTGFDGEAQTLSNAREITFIANMVPVVSQNIVGYQPTLGSARDGVTIEATPELADDGASARLSLRGSAQSVRATPGPTTRPAGLPGADAMLLLVERPVIEHQAIDTRLRVPVNAWVLVGTVGTTEAREGERARPLYLLVRVDADVEAAE